MPDFRLGDALDRLRELPSESVHFAMTSPPYWALRNYANLPGQDGLEKSPAEYIARQMAVFDEVRRVLRPDGTLSVNIGATFSSAGGSGRQGATGQRADRSFTLERDGGTSPADGIPAKSLCLIPERFALAMVERGWVLRNKVVWHKRNSMPSSARDRMKCTYEPCYFFAKSGKYYSDVEAVRQQLTGAAQERRKYGYRHFAEGNRVGSPEDNRGTGHAMPAIGIDTSAGANPGDYLDGADWPEDVLELTAQPSKLQHFAMYPVRLPLWFMRWLMPRAVCPECGKAWRRETVKGEPVQQHWAPGTQEKIDIAQGRHGDTSVMNTGHVSPSMTLGWQPACECGKAPIGPTILDPYAGAGTTAAAAEYLWTHPAEGLDTVLAGARMEPTRPGGSSKFHSGDGSQRPEYAKARMVKTGQPTSVFQPYLPGRALMIELNPDYADHYQARRDECFASLMDQPPALATAPDTPLLENCT
ncbi:MAG: site-specific DNA-methyltransferase [Phycisphaerae bacterium]|nr:site-specific DNA-methyltransferase [Phycisphaerae bacterium]